MFHSDNTVVSAVRSSTGDDENTPTRPARRFTYPRRERLIAGLLLLLAVAFNLYFLLPEVTIRIPDLNDGVLHRLGVGRAVTALFLGQNPTDPWLAGVALGYPLFHHYQHLPYLPPAALHLVSLGSLPLDDVFNWTRYLLLSLFPLSLYGSMRRFGFGRLPAALGGLVAPLLATDGLYGLDFASYVWGGYGLYTQLWGMLLLPPALAQGYVVLREGRGYVWAVLLLAATLLSHLLFGYIALLSLGLFVVLGALGQGANGASDGCSGRPVTHPPPEGGGSHSPLPTREPHREASHRGWGRGSDSDLPAPVPPTSVWQRIQRLVLLLSLVALVTAYFWVPFLLDSAYMNRSVWEEAGKYDSYGYAWVLDALTRGALFDFGRFLSLTLLAGAGLALCLWRWRQERYRLPVVLFLFWLLLYFGRPTWGALLDLLPMSRDLHLHRLIAGVHLGGILLMGIGLSIPWEWTLSRRGARYLLAPAALTVLLLAPVYRERAAYLGQNAAWMAETQTALAAEAGDIEALTDRLWASPPGRVYAGLAGTWGRDYKIGAVPVYALLQRDGLEMLGYLYHALSLNADVQVLFDESRPEQYRLFNVRYVVAPADHSFPGFVRPVADFGRHRLYQVATTGYFDLVGSDLAFAGHKRDLYPAASRWLSSGLLWAGQHPALFLGGAPAADQRLFPLSQAGDLIARTPLQANLSRGRVVWEKVESNAYLAQVEVERESTLMLKVTYHPNWRAAVDGVPARTLMVMPSYLGVKLAPGVHHVRLAYRPRPVRSTLLILGLLALPLIALAEWRQEALARLAGRLGPVRLTTSLGRVASQVTPRPARLGAPLLAATRRAGRARLAPHLPYLCAMALMTLLAGLPLFQFKIMSGHDALEYLPRAVEFYRGLEAGQVFPRWAPDLSGGYGQPFFNFNPPLFYYVAAFFHLLGFSFVAAQNLACLALLLLAGLGMYLLAGDVFGRRGGLVSAVAYLFAPYLLVTLYVRHALADFSALAVIPLVFWGLYRFVREGRQRFLLIGAPSLALLLLSSNPIALVTFPACLLFLAWLALGAWHRSDSDLGVPLLRGFWCLGLGLGLSAFFWLPALAERDLVQTARLLSGYLNYRQHFVYLYQFFLSPWGYGLSLPGPVDGMSFALGTVHLLLIGASLLLLGRIRRAPGRGGTLVSFFLLLLLLAAFFASTASMLLWEKLPLLPYLEFPWRFLSLAAVGTAFVCGFPFLLLKETGGRLAGGLMGVLILALFLVGFPHARPEGFLAATDADCTPWTIAAQDIPVTTAREYEPVYVRERPQTPVRERLTLVAGEGQVAVSRLSPAAYEFRVRITEQARLRVNTFYFPGWTLSVDGVERLLEISKPHGLMEFSLERGEHLVQLRFTHTSLRGWATGLSWLALFLLLLAPWLARVFHS